MGGGGGDTIPGEIISGGDREREGLPRLNVTTLGKGTLSALLVPRGTMSAIPPGEPRTLSW